MIFTPRCCCLINIFEQKTMETANIGYQNGTQVQKNDYIYRKIRNMVIISSREFRANQSKYLKMASNGEDVILKSRGNGNFKIVPLTTDDTLMTRAELDAKINQATKDYENGDFTSINTPEELKRFLESL